MNRLLKRVFTKLILSNQWLSDETYLKLLFRINCGSWLNFRSPETFQEKIQWLKLYGHKQSYTAMVDKVAVKEYVSRKIGEEYVIPLIGVWPTFDDIDFDLLPDQFVLKTSHGGGSCGVVVCKEKSKLDIEKARKILTDSLNSDIYKSYREWPYKNVPRQILAEQYLELEGKSDLTDYKIFCFNGEPKLIQVIQDRHIEETIDFFDTEWNHQEFYGLTPDVLQAKQFVKRPINLDKMLEIAKTLSKDIPFLRVDMYEVNGKVYFGEMTFYPASGFGTFTPKEWNRTLGSWINLFN